MVLDALGERHVSDRDFPRYLSHSQTAQTFAEVGIFDDVAIEAWYNEFIHSPEESHNSSIPQENAATHSPSASCPGKTLAPHSRCERHEIDADQDEAANFKGQEKDFQQGWSSIGEPSSDAQAKKKIDSPVPFEKGNPVDIWRYTYPEQRKTIASWFETAGGASTSPHSSRWFSVIVAVAERYPAKEDIIQGPLPYPYEYALRSGRHYTTIPYTRDYISCLGNGSCLGIRTDLQIHQAVYGYGHLQIRTTYKLNAYDSGPTLAITTLSALSVSPRDQAMREIPQEHAPRFLSAVTGYDVTKTPAGIFVLDVDVDEGKAWTTIQRQGVAATNYHTTDHLGAIEMINNRLHRTNVPITIRLIFSTINRDLPDRLSKFAETADQVKDTSPYHLLTTKAQGDRVIASSAHVVPPDVAFNPQIYKTPEAAVTHFVDREERSVRLAYASHEEQKYQEAEAAFLSLRPQWAV